jgi:hypothetical protein
VRVEALARAAATTWPSRLKRMMEENTPKNDGGASVKRPVEQKQARARGRPRTMAESRMTKSSLERTRVVAEGAKAERG